MDRYWFVFYVPTVRRNSRFSADKYFMYSPRRRRRSDATFPIRLPPPPPVHRAFRSIIPHRYRLTATAAWKHKTPFTNTRGRRSLLSFRRVTSAREIRRQSVVSRVFSVGKFSVVRAPSSSGTCGLRPIAQPSCVCVSCRRAAPVCHVRILIVKVTPRRLWPGDFRARVQHSKTATARVRRDTL